MWYTSGKMRRGLTLLEVIFSLSLMGLIILLVTNIFPTSMLAVRQAETRHQADQLAENLLTKQAAGNFEDLVIGPGLELPAVPLEDGTELLPTLEVFQVEDSNTDYLKGLRVTVRWTYQSNERRVTHELWVADLLR